MNPYNRIVLLFEVGVAVFGLQRGMRPREIARILVTTGPSFRRCYRDTLNPTLNRGVNRVPAEAVEDLMSFGFMPAPPEMLEPVPSAVHPEEVMRQDHNCLRPN